MSKHHILVTGADGFIGRHLCSFLKEKDQVVRAAVRARSRDIVGADEYISVGDLGPQTDWAQALLEVDVVIHLAARVHILKKSVKDPFAAFRDVNVAATERLARMAVQAGVKRFIFISSVKVNGEGSSQAYTERDIPAPQDAYGISKKEAEEVLIRLAKETGLEVVILRLPLVYGLGVKANFKNLIKLAGLGVPLPFKGVHNQRSFLYVGNLVEVISICIDHSKAVNETFLVSDGQDMSTADLLNMLALAMNKKAVLFSLHFGVLKILCKFTGKADELQKLTGSLFVDNRKITTLLGWKPRFSVKEGIAQAIQKTGS